MIAIVGIFDEEVHFGTGVGRGFDRGTDELSAAFSRFDEQLIGCWVNTFCAVMGNKGNVTDRSVSAF